MKATGGRILLASTPRSVSSLFFFPVLPYLPNTTGRTEGRRIMYNNVLEKCFLFPADLRLRDTASFFVSRFLDGSPCLYAECRSPGVVKRTLQSNS
ncbi:hypothetical protein EDB81DRAFT_789602 [Dactylonectria macrodidyma]|uniref:Uncharacterized protein n=1 Tax=Dactylonectria macrodidyma TaxID=307937 RepID=A0A9P9F4D7_9HYPO|nr:hypothetical protein EDB81DRAFT_789602 [Dactylonectria macrodidyma]